MSELAWTEVTDSERITAMAYDAEAEAICVRFTKGDVEWCYEECPPHVWEEFSNPEQSKGQYIHQVLNHKTNHRYG